MLKFQFSQNANPKSQMTVLEAGRPSPSLVLVQLSSKSTVKYSNSTIKCVIDEVVNILTVFLNAC